MKSRAFSSINFSDFSILLAVMDDTTEFVVCDSGRTLVIIIKCNENGTNESCHLPQELTSIRYH